MIGAKLARSQPEWTKMTMENNAPRKAMEESAAGACLSDGGAVSCLGFGNSLRAECFRVS